jgi:hypothetical protein
VLILDEGTGLRQNNARCDRPHDRRSSRGQGTESASLDAVEVAAPAPGVDVVALNEALAELAELDPRLVNTGHELSRDAATPARVVLISSCQLNDEPDDQSGYDEQHHFAHSRSRSPVTGGTSRLPIAPPDIWLTASKTGRRLPNGRNRSSRTEDVDRSSISTGVQSLAFRLALWRLAAGPIPRPSKQGRR